MIYSFSGHVRFSEIDENGKLTPYGLINYLQDCATFHGEAAGCGFQKNRENHRAWVIASLQLKVQGLQPGDARGVYKNTQMDLRIYKRLQMWTHAEALVGDHTDLKNGDLSVFLRIGSDVKNNYYEYEVPLELTPFGQYSLYSSRDRSIVWPQSNYLDIALDNFPAVKVHRNRDKSAGTASFTADAQTFEEWINDSGEYSDTVPIKYNPNNPQEFHVDEGDEFEGIPDENGDLSGNEDADAEPEGGSRTVKLTLMGIGLIILGIGIFILIDGLRK